MKVQHKLLSILGLSLLLIIAGLFILPSKQDSSSTDLNNTQVSASDMYVGEVVIKDIKEFTAKQFKDAFDELSHPNIVPIVNSPSITGIKSVDDYIVSLAEKRGYTLRNVASGLLNKVEDIEVQELLIEDWTALKDQAKSEGINIDLVSGYRSIEEQTELFNQRLSALGLSSTQIKDVKNQSVLDSLLSVTAPPGYSRHHSGYTIDVKDPGFNIFEGSPAHQWISKDNYKNAKEYGFIPSYPEGLESQGPNPEPWEYVWVSREVTHNTETVSNAEESN